MAVLLALAEIAALGVIPSSGAVAACGGRPATVVGTERSEDLRGTPGSDVIAGMGGDDRIRGGDGNDVVCGGAGRDVVRGDRGRDQLNGGGGEDRLIGGVGNDTLVGEGGDDVLLGGEGRDLLSGGSGADLLSGGAGTDVADGGHADDTCRSNEVAASCEAIPPLGLWAAEFMTRSETVTVDEARSQARTFDYIVAPRAMYGSSVDEMKAADPDVALLVYLNGTFVPQPDLFPDWWYARDADGQKIRSREFGNWLMNPANGRWAQHVADRCASLLHASRYDGCFIDTLGAAPLDPGYVTSAPIDPRTGQVWSRTAWLAATARIGSVTSERVSPHPVFGNGLASGASYFDTDGPSERILDGLDGAMAELFVRPPTAPIDSYRDPQAWLQDVEMLLDAAERGDRVLAMTKVWTDGTPAQKDAWHRYALATFLLGYTPGLTYFSFRYDRGSSFLHRYWSLDLGHPLGPYEQDDSIYRRRFRNGRVLVNPSTTPVVVDLPGPYRTLEGERVNSVTLAPHAGEILIRI
jgi:hypothetical protein